MKRSTIVAAAICAAGLICARPSAAQNVSHFTFDAGAGFSQPVEHTDGRLDTGFNIRAGVGYNFVPRFGVVAQFGYDQFGLTSAVLSRASAPDGSARLYSVTLNPIIHFNPRGRMDPYVIGGGGYYRRTVEFTQPTLASATVFDPFFFGFYNVPVVANQVLGSFTQNKAGWNIGAGVSFRVKEDSHAKIFAESRYQYIYTTPVRTSVLPVTFGLRW
jgi:opacity protein-like surface antigen